MKYAMLRFFASKKRRRNYGIFFLLLLISLLLLQEKENLHFQHICQSIFRQNMQSNTLNLHYTLEQPWRYGIFQKDAVLPVYTAREESDTHALMQTHLQALSQIDSEKLSASNLYRYRLLQRKLTLQQKKIPFTYYQEPLSPSSGMQQNLPILLSEYRFRKQKDVENYLSLLSQTDGYFQGLLQFEKEKAAHGLLMSRISAQTVAHQCDTFLTKESIENESHFLITSFKDRLEKLQKEKRGYFSSKQLQNYLQQNKDILLTVVLPAYQRLAVEMTALAASPYASEQSHGLAHKPDGQQYYALLIQDVVGSYREPSQIGDMLWTRFHSLLSQEKQARSISTSSDALISETTDSSIKGDDSSDSFSLQTMSPEQMLAYLKAQTQKDFPPLPETGIKRFFPEQEASPSYHIKKIAPSLTAHAAPAFYLIPPIDSQDTHLIYLNPDSDLKELALFTTLAHEGFPGHLYQTAYAHQTGIYPVFNPIRSILSYEGYAEGWAYYVEQQSYTYAEKLFSASYDAQKLSRELSLCLCALMDFHIHYYDMSYTQCQAFLSSLGFSEQQTDQLFQYIVQEPCSYLKYYVSYLEILALQEQAKMLWQDAYSDFAFYQFYLHAGPSDFIALQSLME